MFRYNFKESTSLLLKESKKQLTNRFLLKIDINTTGETVYNNKRRRCKVIGTHAAMNATLEIAISRQNSRDNQIILKYRPLESASQW